MPHEKEHTMTRQNVLITQDVAAQVLGVLQRKAALLLEQSSKSDPRRAELATLIRRSEAGGNAVEGLNQNSDDTQHETLPPWLDSGWRVLCSFEQIALGGDIVKGVGIQPSRHGVEAAKSWVLHDAAQAIDEAAAHGDVIALGLAAVAEEFRSCPIEQYVPLQSGY